MRGTSGIGRPPFDTEKFLWKGLGSAFRGHLPFSSFAPASFAAVLFYFLVFFCFALGFGLSLHAVAVVSFVRFFCFAFGAVSAIQGGPRENVPSKSPPHSGFSDNSIFQVLLPLKTVGWSTL